jgi:hypothetical protein
MRAAFSILGLVIALAVVLFMVKQQARTLAPPPVPSSALGSAASATATRPEAVRQEVQQLLDQAAVRASEAQP